MTDKFFNKQFWRMVAVASISQIIVLCFAVAVSIFIGSKIDKLTMMFSTANETLTSINTTIETVTNIDTQKLAEQSESLKESADTVGQGVGDGGAEIVDRVGDAWKKFQEGKDDQTE